MEHQGFMPIKVFIADDHAVVRDGLRALLEAQADIAVIGDAANGRETVRQVQRLCPDVVVMDITMPELNGIEATQQIRESCPSTQVLVLSMHSSREHVYRALQAGARGYLIKESASKEVAVALRVLHAGRRYFSQQITDTVIDDYMHHRQISSGQGPLGSLSSREREVLQLVVEGKSSAEIANILFLSTKTVETYRSRVMQKLEIHDLPGLTKFAIEHGITSFK
jgi:DNA-binding NarL/FixJ family response regulator